MASPAAQGPSADGSAADFPAPDGSAFVPGKEPGRRAGHWDIRARLSSVLEAGEAFLEAHPFERGIWLVVAFAAGIVLWVALPGVADWTGALLALGGLSILGLIWRDEAGAGHVRLAVIGLSVMAAAGMTTIWTKSVLAGQPAIDGPRVIMVQGRITERREEAAKARVRLILRTQIEGSAGAVLVRINVPDDKDRKGAEQGAFVRLRARLMPPASPMLPGGYDFARTAWFGGIAATGSAISPVEVLQTSDRGVTLRGMQSGLADHVRSMLAGSPGNIAAAFASGDRGAIAVTDEEAMRDAGLTHLLSISGLHVSALIGAVYWIIARVLSLFPWIALRLRVPVAAALAGALAGVAYTLLTGAEVPTIRSCIGALLVLGALALGRDPLSMRLVAVGGLVVMVFWPEAVLGPSFQMSFAAVMAIIAFHSAAPVRNFMSGEHHGPVARAARSLIMLLATGLVIETALMPIGLFHFHRAGVYGSIANVIAIPLTTFVTMPLIGIALLLDLGGMGAPAWWLCGKSLELLLAIAHFVAAQPGAVTMLPPVAPWSFVMFIVGMLWLALWTGKVRLWGLFPATVAVTVMVLARPPDILVTGDGHHVGMTDDGADLLVLRTTRGDYVRDSLLEMAGMEGEVKTLDQWPGAKCSPEFCAFALVRGRKRFVVLAARNREYIDDMDLAAACERVDIVIADRRLPFSCKPRMLKADRILLAATGGITIDLASGKIRTVAETQGRHGWYRWPEAPELNKLSRTATQPREAPPDAERTGAVVTRVNGNQNHRNQRALPDETFRPAAKPSVQSVPVSPGSSALPPPSVEGRDGGDAVTGQPPT
ncbi:ComEC/Rec2 family competence protein [Novosphingobium sp. MMS21-SN21R]|uniref:ComEC/Rec2 family competence protein n=1 Tax=Novosphingobium sp. MMS21-SN21R TaxID=2969298 RepID=UPI00288839A3|nr:ComEC/Rec2 family competence protein [Novosphingobium sp. MMS21-SN21R]MDT0507985.1 ComEC/Rec2 family competence protein [Novosphingobium sp. MMS21-SN21R]